MLAIIGGTGLSNIPSLKILQETTIDTPYGACSGPIIEAEYENQTLFFLARHGQKHQIPPHRVNYRANIWALKQLSVNNIIAVNAVGGISDMMAPGCLVLPNQIIDYSYGRKHTYFDENLEHVTHIDFTEPYAKEIRQSLFEIGLVHEIAIVNGGVYGCTQGPRLETAAEIKRLKQDGCDIVGMTGMPEAALAAELELCYASLSVVANWGAGLSDEPISMEKITQVMDGAMQKVILLIEHYLRLNQD